MDFVQYHEEPIKLSSGRLSHWFVDGRAIFESPPHRELVLAFWEKRLAFDRYRWHLVPVPTGGNRWAQALAPRVGVAWCEGIPVGAAGWDFERIAVIEDVVTTGTSVRKKIEEVREALGKPHLDVPVLAVVRRRGSVPGLNVLACFRMELPDFEESDRA